MRGTVTKIKQYQSRNIFIKLDHTWRYVNDLKKSDIWKIQITIEINFMSSKDTDEEPVMHLKSYNIEILINKEADEIIEKLF